MKCGICNAEAKEVFRHTVLGKYDIAYFKCDHCGFLFAGNPFWLSEAYENSITSQDTGLLSRNVDLVRKISVILYYLFYPDGQYLDYAGGYGVFTRLMRDSGFNFFHTDPYTRNLFANDFEWDGGSVDGVTCFECFEHFPDPIIEIEKLLSISRNIIFSTVLLPSDVPPVLWDYYAFDHGQHISFYSHQTLAFIARKFDFYVSSVGNLHVFSDKKFPEKRLRWLLRKANRLPHVFARKTLYRHVVKKMKSRKDR